MKEGEAGFYYCGPTVWNYGHIGNFRSAVAADILRRYLKFKGFRVTHVMNITDVDDRIISEAQKAGVSIDDYTAKYIDAFWEDFDALGCERPEVVPRATRHIPEMATLIGQLISSEHAYRSDDSIYYRIASFPSYGKLSKINFAGNIAGASERVDTDKYEKEDARDFALWKGPSTETEPAWDTSIGRGRPGWHIECSAMSWKHLGETFDIHGGGIDLVFPHHENEIAQSRCAFHTPLMANFWMHNGFLQVEGEKMSKSLGNFVTINDLLKEWPGEVIRFTMLQTHYRQPMNWTLSGLRESQKNLDHWYKLTGDAAPGYLCADTVDALLDDLNTPKAFAALHELRGEAAKGAKPAAASLKASAQLIGLLQLSPAQWAGFRPASAAVDENKVVSLIEARNSARKAKNFKEADRIRDELTAMGIELEDTKDGKTKWKVAR